MVAMPITAASPETNILMCCADMVPHYLVSMRDCRQVAPPPWPAQCATVVLADMGTIAWCCAESELLF